jgi:hypothetical protein
MEQDSALSVQLPERGTSFEWRTGELRKVYFDALPRRMNPEA